MSILSLVSFQHNRGMAVSNLAAWKGVQFKKMNLLIFYSLSL